MCTSLESIFKVNAFELQFLGKLFICSFSN